MVEEKLDFKDLKQSGWCKIVNPSNPFELLKNPLDNNKLGLNTLFPRVLILTSSKTLSEGSSHGESCSFLFADP